MKAISFTVLVLCFSFVFNAQNVAGETPDSMAMASRTKADLVLQHFDTIVAPKLLYSSSDKYFYVIIGNKPSYKEYYVVLDSSGEIDEVRLVGAETKTREQRKQQEQYRKILSEAEPIFDISGYHTNFMAAMPDAEYMGGRYTYFVVKDIDGKRYGEYRLPALTLPSPINGNLWVYLIRRLSEQMYK